ncbi:hypothetical protein G5V58_12850 [Nocardioides anomalus]|uniref:Signal peptidase I n=1 Tax=Nocardioides anomalus TaxID=2712223 RepID=A0A6G6WDV6_9ACTN|nr:S26 family signal peptidase [Nocardioides anomalus]QIG43531.1 hypothetical protein G5V58_12850 [Nocardioides anomalus]
MSGRLVVRALEVAVLAVVLAAFAYCAWFRWSGGHWERVETPSMGTTAPVGTLVWVRPVDPEALRSGQVVSFRPPGRQDVYTHRITAVHADGTFSTAGDLSGPDTWTIPAGNVIGRVQWLWPGAGRAVEAAPILILGGVLTWGVALLWRRQTASVVLVGAAATLAVAVVVFRPLTDAEQLAFVQVPGGARATYVGTGLLPVRLVAPGDDSVVLRPGQAGSVVARRAEDRRLSVRLEPDVPRWFWVGLVTLCFLPALGRTVLALRRRPQGPLARTDGAVTERPDPGRRSVEPPRVRRTRGRRAVSHGRVG